MAASSHRVRSLVPLAYLVAGIAWVLGSDVLLGLATPLGLTAHLLGSAKGVAFVVMSAVVIYVVQAWPSRPDTDDAATRSELQGSARWLRPVAIFLVTSIGVALAGYVVNVQQAAEVRRRAADTLAHSAEMATLQFELRVNDWQAALDTAGRNPLVAEALRATVAAPSGPEAGRLRAGLEVLRLGDEFERVQAFDPDLRPVAHAGGVVELTPMLRALMAEARRTGHVAMSDLYTPPGRAHARPTLDFVVTLGDPLTPDATPGVLVARADLGPHLFPLLQPNVDGSPTPIYTLARRDGDRVLVLRPSTRSLSATTKFSFVPAEAGAPSVEILGGRRGVFETRDVNGRDVLATGRAIGGTPWTMIAKVDRDAVEAPLQRLTRLALLLGFAALASSALLISLWWRNERIALRRRIDTAEHRALVLKEHFSLAGRLVHDIVLLLDAADGRIVEANDRAIDAYGYAPDELIGRTVFELRPPDSREIAAAKARFARVLATGGDTYATAHWRRDGRSFPIEISARTCTIEGRNYVQMIGRDISERVEQERRLAVVAAERDRLLERLQLQFDRMVSACIVLDCTGVITQINPAFERTFGWTPGRAVGRPFRDVVLSAAFRDEMTVRVQELLQAPDAVYTAVHENLTVSGRPLVCRWTASALCEGSVVHGVIAMADDITEQIEAERALRTSEERYRTLTEMSPVGIFRTDVSGATLLVNQRFRAITGLGAEASLGHGWTKAVHAEDAAVVGLQWSRYVQKAGSEPYDSEFRLVRPDGAVAWVLSQVRPEFDARGTLIGHVGTLTDVTALKDSQRALEESRDYLEERVAQRTSELEAAKNAAERSDRVKSAFLSTMSHELRTPLNSILGFTDVLLHGLSGPITDAQRRQLEIVRDSSTHLRALIEDVLDISRIEAGQIALEFTDVDLRELLARRVESFEAEAARKGVSLGMRLAEALPTARCDRKRAGQIVNNLVSNALKFTDKGSVTVTARVEGEHLVVEVADTGVGIGADSLPLLFNPFTQVLRPGGRLHEGTGLGLAISRNLARAMGGDIVATSIIGAGSRFAWRHPLEPGERDAASTTGAYTRLAIREPVAH